MNSLLTKPNTTSSSPSPSPFATESGLKAFYAQVLLQLSQLLLSHYKLEQDGLTQEQILNFEQKVQSLIGQPARLFEASFNYQPSHTDLHTTQSKSSHLSKQAIRQNLIKINKNWLEMLSPQFFILDIEKEVSILKEKLLKVDQYEEMIERETKMNIQRVVQQKKIQQQPSTQPQNEEENESDESFKVKPTQLSLKITCLYESISYFQKKKMWNLVIKNCFIQSPEGQAYFKRGNIRLNFVDKKVVEASRYLSNDS